MNATTLKSSFASLFHQISSAAGLPQWTAPLVGTLLVFVASWIAYKLVRNYLLRILTSWVDRSSVKWDDILLEETVLSRASWFAPLLVVFYGLKLVEGVPVEILDAMERGSAAILLFVALMTISALLASISHLYSTLPVSKDRPIKGYLQIVGIVAWVVGVVTIVALLLNRSPVAFITGIGAMTAVLILVFRDTILSFVASIQIVSNDMVRIGDWIEMPKYGADGDVIDIALHTIKVQNFDKTITTIPTWKLIEDSFRNWRGMTEAGGRRIKRSIHIDMSTIRFLDDDDLKQFSRFDLLADYIAKQKADLTEHQRTHVGDASFIANVRRLSNIGTFRAYVISYLRQNPEIHQSEMTFLVRQLEPKKDGLPIEIYVFTKTTDWIAYETIQADIFDHILSILPEFGLRVFQQPSSWDFAKFGGDRTGSAEPVE